MDIANQRIIHEFNFNKMKTYSLYLFIFLFPFVFSCSQNKKMQQTDLNVLAGTYTDGKSDGIYRLSFNTETGKLTNEGLIATAENPSFLVTSSDRQYLYTVNETDSGGVSSFKWDEETQRYNLINSQYSQGVHPCYIALNDKENLLAAANYSSGNIAVYRLGQDGRILDNRQVRQHKGTGPVEGRQEGPHAHYSQFSGDGRFLYAVDLGTDEILAYSVSAEGRIGEGHAAIEMDAGDGPRHLVFHPSKNYAFVVNELSNTVVSMAVDRENGKFNKIDKVSTLPDDFQEHSQCADIHISSDGRFLYASNRGHNSIAIFEVSEDGTLKRVGIEPVRGDWPRNFALSPDGRFLLVANQNSNNVVVFKIDSETGLLTYTGNQTEVFSPVCLKF